MIIDSVEVTNFQPYYGEQRLELSRGAAKSFVAIEGDNMAGKTTILNAIRWCLYRVAKGRDGRDINHARLLNDDARAEGATQFSVRLKIQDGGREIELYRQYTASVPDPKTVDDFEEYKSVAVDGAFLAETEFTRVVSDLLPEDISRFFLFDGELLNEYEALVQDDGRHGSGGVREAIELILGLPAARRAREDVRALKELVARRLARANARDSRYAQASKDWERLSQEKTRLINDRDDLYAETVEKQGVLEGVEADLSLYQESREEIGRLQEARKNEQNVKAQIVAKQERRRALAADVWRDVLTPWMKTQTGRLEEDRDRRSSAMGRVSHLRGEIERLQADISHTRCSECGRGLSASEAEHIEKEIVVRQAEVERLAPEADPERHEAVATVLRQLRKVAPAGIVAAIKEVERDLKQLELDLYQAEEAIKTSERKLEGVKEDKVEELVAKQKELQVAINERENSVRRLRDKIGELDVDLERERRKMEDNDSPASQKLVRQNDVLEVLEEISAQAVEDMTQELRRKVEEEASDIFRQLTHGKDYDRLAINEQFGLTIIRKNGEPVMVRSAGAEQIVALSLIGALNRLAGKQGPVIMDTPFGRLDRVHRANIIKFLPTMADQVALLVHDGELDLERDLDPIKGQLTERYRINHTTDGRSDIQRVTEMTNA